MISNEMKYVLAAMGVMCIVAKAGGERLPEALTATYTQIGKDKVLLRLQVPCIDSLLTISERLDRDFYGEFTSLITRIISYGLPYEAADRIMRMAMAVALSEKDLRTEQIDAIGHIAGALGVRMYDYLTGENLVTH